MIFIVNPCCDPFFNISCEEFLLKNFSDDCFMLWRNYPSIIVGKHQNTLAEINHDFVFKNNVPVIRRLSGGGTVFHDLGNINFTFITNNISGKSIDFQKFLKPVVEVLHELSIPATLNSRNNIFIGDKKITGTGAHLAKNKVLHHGTLLFKTSLNDLNKAIEADSQKYSDKSIKSVRSPVTNIYDSLIEKIEISEFIELLEKKIKKRFVIETDYLFQKEDIKKIEHLADTKYRTWEWNYGYSPSYQFLNHFVLEDIKISIELQVKKGIIEFIRLSNDSLTINKTDIETALISQPHEKVHIENSLAPLSFSKIVKDIFIKNIF